MAIANTPDVHGLMVSLHCWRCTITLQQSLISFGLVVRLLSASMLRPSVPGEAFLDNSSNPTSTMETTTTEQTVVADDSPVAVAKKGTVGGGGKFFNSLFSLSEL
jgi:hypothetical protein